jgi:hypothetical protein
VKRTIESGEEIKEMGSREDDGENGKARRSGRSHLGSVPSELVNRGSLEFLLRQFRPIRIKGLGWLTSSLGGMDLQKKEK